MCGWVTTYSGSPQGKVQGPEDGFAVSHLLWAGEGPLATW